MDYSKLYYKYWPEDVPKTIDIPEKPLDSFLREAAAEFPDAVATTYFGVPLTYKKLDEIADRVATVLYNLGIKKGDTVALHFTNVPPFIASYYGALRAGARLTLLSPLFKKLEIKYQLIDSDAKVLICWEGFDQLVEPVISETKVEHVIHSNLGAWFMADPTEKGEPISTDPDVVYLEDLIQATVAEPPHVEIDPMEDIACLQYTGGTTGLPKGAMLTHNNIYSNVMMMRAIFSEAEPSKEVILVALPLYHIYAQVVGMHFGVSLAANLVLITNPRETGELIEAIEDNAVTVFPGVAALFNNINIFPGIEEKDMSSIKYCTSGAGPLPLEIQETFEKLTGAKLREAYGLTEASPMTHANPFLGRFKNGTVGLPAPNTDMKIVDIETGRNSLGPNEVGELCVKGPQVMKGYYKKEEETRNTIRDGWLYTGDAATIDEEGYTTIKERLKNMLKYKGHSVYPAEVESLLYEHEAILECAVIGIPDPEVGENIKAFITLKEDFKGKVSGDDIINWSKENMGYDKYPRIVEFLDEIPKSRIGKVLHRLLREGKTDILD
ncbi:MAG: long-chain-fatty-acid--CoA ligase [Promethearchaeota archaeon]